MARRARAASIGGRIGPRRQIRFHPAVASEASQRRLEAGLEVARSEAPRPKSSFRGVWRGLNGKEQYPTAVDRASLVRLASALAEVPDSFKPHPRLGRLLKRRADQAAGKRPLDWAMAELLAYATLLQDGHARETYSV